MLNKKYLIASGCSFTEGHLLGEKGSWATFFAKNNNLELINLGKGGAGNEYILSQIIQFAKIEKHIADNAIFGIQLTEVLRTLMCFTYPKDEYMDGKYWHITPVQFLDDKTFSGWDLNSFHNKWIYDNRNALSPFFINVTHSVLITINALISFIDFCEVNNYPYFIFDGLNKSIPEKLEDGWYLNSTNKIDVHKINVEDVSDNFHFFKNAAYPVINKSIIDYIRKNPYYIMDRVCKEYLFTTGNDENDGEKYVRGNQGHPNELGSEFWANYIQSKLNNLFGKIN